MDFSQKSYARLDEFFCYVLRMGIIVACIQETWRSDIESLQNGQCMLLLAGRDTLVQARKRGALVIAVRLLLRDRANRDVAIFLVSVYAPVGSKSDDIWNEYYDQLD